MFGVIKRDGMVTDFNLTKINDAVMKAFNATEAQYNNDIIDLLALRVTADFQSKVKDGCIHVEDIQDSVEKVLEQAGYADVAKAYILYRKQREKMRTMKSTILDYKDVVNSYVKVEDWRVKENSTVTYSVGGLILSNSGAVTANYWLSEIYDSEIADAHRNADIHIHDLSMLTGYCAGWSLKQLISEGLGGITGKITSAPAAHLSVLCNQMVNFLGIMQNEWAGAQAFSSFDTYLAPFVKADNLGYEDVKKAIESFIYGVNTPSRWGTQAPFTNITLDWTVPNDLAELPALVGGKEMDFKYKDCKHEMDMINKAFLETMIEGDANGRGFQYPIPTYSITKDFDWTENENNRLLFDMTSKYGTPYFSNYINSDMEPSDVRSMCCRLRLDLRELRKKTGGFFGSGESTGSVGVVTINMPRIAYLSANKDEFYKRLNHMMDIAARSLKIKRGVISKLLDEGLYPYTRRYLGNFDNHFSTIGLIGMNEVGLNANWLRADMSEKRTQEFTKEVLNHMRNRLSDYQEQYKDLYNLEATPAESTTYRLAKHDRKRWPSIKTAGKPGDVPYYTNSSHLPVDYTTDIFDALDIQDDLQSLYTSGTVFHAFLGEKLPDWKAAASLVKSVAENYKLPYYTLSPTYSVCKTHGYLAGEQNECPECGGKTEIYSRITGYYRPVQNWNDGKLQEYKNRTEYVVEQSTVEQIKFDAGEEEQQVMAETSVEETIETPVFEQPIMAETVAEAPAEEVIETPVYEQPIMAEAVVEASAEEAVETSVFEQPIMAEAVAETSVFEQQVMEEAVAETPVYEQPIMEEAVVETPIYEQPIMEEAVAEAPVFEQPVMVVTPAEEPMVSTPSYGSSLFGESEDNKPTSQIVTLSTFEEDADVEIKEPENIKYLFTTKTCPNCKLAKEYLGDINYILIDAEENMELAARYGVMQAPTLVVLNGDSHRKYVNASNIKAYAEEAAVMQ